MTIKSPKAASAAECRSLEQLPNIGPALAADLRLILGVLHVGAFAVAQRFLDERLHVVFGGAAQRFQ